MSHPKKVRHPEIKPLEIVTYGHPSLRSQGSRIATIDDSILRLAEEMLTTMYENDGCGLAAQQVGRSLQLAVIDVLPAFENRPSQAWLNGREIELSSLMPLVLINPVIHPVGNQRVLDTEGCLSIPDLQDEIDRPARVRIVCQDLSGSTLDFEAEGLLARAAQHEVDHLHGILFIDYLSPDELRQHQPLLRKLQARALEF